MGSTGIVLCQKYSAAIEDILPHMEAFLSNNSQEVLALETFGRFEQEIHRESTKVHPNEDINLVAPFSPSLQKERIKIGHIYSLIELDTNHLLQGPISVKRNTAAATSVSRPPLAKKPVSMVRSMSSCFINRLSVGILKI